MTKKCFKCLVVKSLDAFYKHPAMSDGRLGKCIECAKADVIANRLAKIAYYRSFDKLRASVPHRVIARKEYSKSELGRLSHAKANKAWQSRYPERKKAAVLVNNAIRDGRLQKLPCFICGNEKVEAHHPAYDMPLIVTWLCQQHHKEIHWHMELKAA